jgi:hypothetical protein
MPSPNPKGRPRKDNTIVGMARVHSADAIKALAEICNNPRAHNRDRVDAAGTLLAYAWGRPPQALQHSGPGGQPLPANEAQVVILPSNGFEVDYNPNEHLEMAKRLGIEPDHIFGPAPKERLLGVGAREEKDEPLQLPHEDADDAEGSLRKTRAGATMAAAEDDDEDEPEMAQPASRTIDGDVCVIGPDGKPTWVPRGTS